MKRADYVMRRMTLEDLPLMRTIEEASFTAPWPGSAYESELTTNRLARYVGAWRDEELLGFGGIWLMVDEAHVTTIAVQPRLRGEGSAPPSYLSCSASHVAVRLALQRLTYVFQIRRRSDSMHGSALPRRGYGSATTKIMVKMR